MADKPKPRPRLGKTGRMHRKVGGTYIPPWSMWAPWYVEEKKPRSRRRTPVYRKKGMK